MPIARLAAEIEPQEWIYSSNWILAGPIRPCPSRSMRMLNEGEALRIGDPIFTTAFREAYYAELVTADITLLSKSLLGAFTARHKKSPVSRGRRGKDIAEAASV
jgi:hypothetical protein